jgi:hypothetical protein
VEFVQAVDVIGEQETRGEQQDVDNEKYVCKFFVVCVY